MIAGILVGTHWSHLLNGDTNLDYNVLISLFDCRGEFAVMDETVSCA